MDFSGTWKVYSEENLEEFLKVIGKKTIKMHFFPYMSLNASFRGARVAGEDA